MKLFAVGAVFAWKSKKKRVYALLCKEPEFYDFLMSQLSYLYIQMGSTS